MELFSLNLVGVSLLPATIDTGNISQNKKVQLVQSRNWLECLHCPHTECMWLVQSVSDTVAASLTPCTEARGVNRSVFSCISASQSAFKR